MIGLIIGLITGYLICMPIGPLGVSIANLTIRKRPAASLALAMGGAIMDFLYFFTILTGLSFFHPPEIFLKFFPLLGTVLILTLGCRDLFFPLKIEQTPEKFPKLSSEKFIGHIFLGMVIYGSNPTLLFTMTAIAAFLKSWWFFPQDTWGQLIASIGLGVGSFGWFATLVFVVLKFRTKVGPKLMTNLHRVSGFGLILIGIYLAIQLGPQFSQVAHFFERSAS